MGVGPRRANTNAPGAACSALLRCAGGMGATLLADTMIAI
jgi:hypothetical protein